MKKNLWFAAVALVAGSSSVALAQGSAPPPEAVPPAAPAVPAVPAAPEAALPAPGPAAPVAPEAAPATPEAPASKPGDKPKPAVTAKYDSGLRFSTADDAYELKLSFRTQMRFEANRRLDDETATRHNQFLSKFYIPRSRLQAEGHLFGGDARYKLEFGLSDSGSFSFVRDLWMDKKLGDKVYLRFGQWKRPFNRQEMVSDFASTFNERSIVNEFAGGGRDLGVAIHNDYEKGPDGIEWVVGAFNNFSGGSDRPTFTTTCTEADTSISCTNSRPTDFPNDFGPTLVGRVAYNHGGIKGYSESDLEGGPLRYAVGASYKVDLANFAKGAKNSWSDNMKHGVEVDSMIKAHGLCVHIAAAMMKLQDADAEIGVMVQPGYMVVPKKLEIGGRFAVVTEKVDDGGTAKDREQIEARAAVNYYFHGHTWKVASDGGFLQFVGDGAKNDKPDLQFRTMLQLQI